MPYYKKGDRMATSIAEKLDLARDFFGSLMGTPTQRGHTINLDMLGLLQLSPELAHDLEVPFTKEEVK